MFIYQYVYIYQIFGFGVIDIFQYNTRVKQYATHQELGNADQ